MNQRWLRRRDRWVPPEGRIDPREYDVVELFEDNLVKEFVERHHYSGSLPPTRWRFGLYRLGTLCGVAVYSEALQAKVLTNVFPAPKEALVELGRFVLLDLVPGNGESWFLARTHELLRGRVRGVVMFSDPVPRYDQLGWPVMPGHVGTIYQATNALYLGRSTVRTLKLFPDGRCFSGRAIQKIRKREQGWVYAAAELVRRGAAPPGEDLEGWLAAWLPRLTQNVRHRGCHRYAWKFDRRLAVLMPQLPYPKEVDRAEEA